MVTLSHQFTPCPKLFLCQLFTNLLVIHKFISLSKGVKAVYLSLLQVSYFYGLLFVKIKLVFSPVNLSYGLPWWLR